MGFRLVPKLVTLDDLEGRNGHYFALFRRKLLPEKNDPSIMNKLRHPKTFQSLTVKLNDTEKHLYHIVYVIISNLV